jgi:hypothetical protein
MTEYEYKLVQDLFAKSEELTRVQVENEQMKTTMESLKLVAKDCVTNAEHWFYVQDFIPLLDALFNPGWTKQEWQKEQESRNAEQ